MKRREEKTKTGNIHQIRAYFAAQMRYVLMKQTMIAAMMMTTATLNGDANDCCSDVNFTVISFEIILQLSWNFAS